MNKNYRAGLPPMPNRIKALNVSEKGYPIPFFVAVIDGKPDFRIVDSNKFKKAIDHDLCWICGGKLGRHKTFVGGSLVLVNRVSAEPPMHRDCAEFAVKACPFLLLPKAKRRDIVGVIDEAEHGTLKNLGGVQLMHNPTVSVLYTTNSYIMGNSDEGVLFHLAQPTTVEWYREGVMATRQQAFDGVNLSIKKLIESLAEQTGRSLNEVEATEIRRRVDALMVYLPTE